MQFERFELAGLHVHQLGVITGSNGITAARVSMVVSISPVKGATRAVWMVMDESGAKPGSVMLDIDANSGVLLSKTKQSAGQRAEEMSDVPLTSAL